METKAIQFAIFDCDGVLVNSNPFKAEAFKFAVRSYPKEDVEKLVEFNRVNGGISRYEKFDHFFRVVLGMHRERCAVEVDKAVVEFSNFCAKGYQHLEPTKGTRKLLECFQLRQIPCYIVSGGDKQEITGWSIKADIFHFFLQIYGNEQSKFDAVHDIFSKNDYESVRGVYYGDATLDAKIANQFGIPFVFVSGYSEIDSGELVFNDISRQVCYLSEVISGFS